MTVNATTLKSFYFNCQNSHQNQLVLEIREERENFVPKYATFI